VFSTFLSIRKIEALLPGTNCTACGAEDCASFARMIVREGSDPARCVVCDAAMIARIRDRIRGA
jgi:Na+-translocating ferredoxin:NAD+ oxidoreductase RNF subunit RnfB